MLWSFSKIRQSTLPGTQLPSSMPRPDRSIGTSVMLFGQMVSAAYSYPMGDVSCKTVSPVC